MPLPKPTLDVPILPNTGAIATAAKAAPKTAPASAAATPAVPAKPKTMEEELFGPQAPTPSFAHIETVRRIAEAKEPTTPDPGAASLAQRLAGRKDITSVTEDEHIGLPSSPQDLVNPVSGTLAKAAGALGEAAGKKAVEAIGLGPSTTPGQKDALDASTQSYADMLRTTYGEATKPFAGNKAMARNTIEALGSGAAGGLSAIGAGLETAADAVEQPEQALIDELHRREKANAKRLADIDAKTDAWTDDEVTTYAQTERDQKAIAKQIEELQKKVDAYNLMHPVSGKQWNQAGPLARDLADTFRTGAESVQHGVETANQSALLKSDSAALKSLADDAAMTQANEKWKELVADDGFQRLYHTYGTTGSPSDSTKFLRERTIDLVNQATGGQEVTDPDERERIRHAAQRQALIELAVAKQTNNWTGMALLPTPKSTMGTFAPSVELLGIDSKGNFVTQQSGLPGYLMNDVAQRVGHVATATGYADLLLRMGSRNLALYNETDQPTGNARGHGRGIEDAPRSAADIVTPAGQKAKADAVAEADHQRALLAEVETTLAGLKAREERVGSLTPEEVDARDSATAKAKRLREHIATLEAIVLRYPETPLGTISTAEPIGGKELPGGLSHITEPLGLDAASLAERFGLQTPEQSAKAETYAHGMTANKRGLSEAAAELDTGAAWSNATLALLTGGLDVIQPTPLDVAAGPAHLAWTHGGETAAKAIAGKVANVSHAAALQKAATAIQNTEAAGHTAAAAARRAYEQREGLAPGSLDGGTGHTIAVANAIRTATEAKGSALTAAEHADVVQAALEESPTNPGGRPVDAIDRAGSSIEAERDAQHAVQAEASHYSPRLQEQLDLQMRREFLARLDEEARSVVDAGVVERLPEAKEGEVPAPVVSHARTLAETLDRLIRRAHEGTLTGDTAAIQRIADAARQAREVSFDHLHSAWADAERAAPRTPTQVVLGSTTALDLLARAHEGTSASTVADAQALRERVTALRERAPRGALTADARTAKAELDALAAHYEDERKATNNRVIAKALTLTPEQVEALRRSMQEVVGHGVDARELPRPGVPVTVEAVRHLDRILTRAERAPTGRAVVYEAIRAPGLIERIQAHLKDTLLGKMGMVAKTILLGGDETAGFTKAGLKAEANEWRKAVDRTLDAVSSDIANLPDREAINTYLDGKPTRTTNTQAPLTGNLNHYRQFRQALVLGVVAPRELFELATAFLSTERRAALGKVQYAEALQKVMDSLVASPTAEAFIDRLAIIGQSLDPEAPLDPAGAKRAALVIATNGCWIPLTEVLYGARAILADAQIQDYLRRNLAEIGPETTEAQQMAQAARNAERRRQRAEAVMQAEADVRINREQADILRRRVEEAAKRKAAADEHLADIEALPAKHRHARRVAVDVLRNMVVSGSLPNVSLKDVDAFVAFLDHKVDMMVKHGLIGPGKGLETPADYWSQQVRFRFADDAEVEAIMADRKRQRFGRVRPERGALDDVARALVRDITSGTSLTSRDAFNAFIAQLGRAIAESRGEPLPDTPETARAFVPMKAQNDLDERLAAIRRENKDTRSEQRAEQRKALAEQAVAAAVLDLADRRRSTAAAETPAQAPEVVRAAAKNVQPVAPGTPADALHRGLGVAGSSDLTATGAPRMVYDDKLKPYRVRLMLVPVDEPLTSHDFRTGQWTPGYETELQNRPDALGRDDMLEARAKTLNPALLSPEGVGLTEGPPVVWRGPDGRSRVLAGNGRAEIIRRALRAGDSSADAYRGYITDWQKALGLDWPEGHTGDAMLVRVVDIAPDNLPEAVALANSSQRGLSPQLSHIDEAISLAIGAREALGGKDVLANPSSIPMELTPEAASELLAENRGLAEAFRAMYPDPVVRDALEPGAVVTGVEAALLLTLDRQALDKVREAGGEAAERILHAMPALVKLHAMAAEKALFRDVDLAPVLGDAITFLNDARAKGATTPAAMANLAMEEASRPHLLGANIPVSAPSVALAIALSTAATMGGERGNAALAKRLRTFVQDAEAIAAPSMFGPRKEAIDVLADLAGPQAADLLRNGKHMSGASDEVTRLPLDHDVARETAQSLTEGRDQIIDAAGGRETLFHEQDTPIAPVFYSQLRRAVDALPQEKMSVEQFRAGIDKAGVRQDEVDWTRLERFLANKRSVTKTDALAWLDEHAVKIEEKEFTTDAARKRDLEVERDDAQALFDSLNYRFKAMRESVMADPDDIAILKYEEKRNALAEELEQAAEARKAAGEAGKLDDEDYYNNVVYDREDAIEAIDRKMGEETVERHPKLAALREERDAAARRYDEARGALDDLKDSAPRWTGPDASGGDYTEPGGQRHRELLISVPDIDPYKEHSHYPEFLHTVARLRMNDRVDLQGRKWLHIEEVQSERGQEGRKHGFRRGSPQDLPPDLAAKASTLEAALQAREAQHPGAGLAVADASRQAALALHEANPQLFPVAHQVRGTIERDGTVQDPTRPPGAYIPMREAMLLAVQDAPRRVRANQPPPMPFAKTWHELAMKRALRIAAEEGYAGVSWTTGDQQNTRYNAGANGVRQMVDSITWHRGAKRLPSYIADWQAKNELGHHQVKVDAYKDGRRIHTQTYDLPRPEDYRVEQNTTGTSRSSFRVTPEGPVYAPTKGAEWDVLDPNGKAVRTFPTEAEANAFRETIAEHHGPLVDTLGEKMAAQIIRQSKAPPLTVHPSVAHPGYWQLTNQSGRTIKDVLPEAKANEWATGWNDLWGEPTGGIIAGDDIGIQTEGMRGFYDRMLPAFVNDYAKRNGWGVRVSPVALDHLEVAWNDIAAQIEKEAAKNGWRTSLYTAQDFIEAMRDDMLKHGSTVDEAYQKVVAPHADVTVREEVSKAIANAGKTYHGVEVTPTAREHLVRRGQRLFQPGDYAPIITPQDYHALWALQRDPSPRGLAQLSDEAAVTWDLLQRAGPMPRELGRQAADVIDAAIRRAVDYIESPHADIDADRAQIHAAMNEHGVTSPQAVDAVKRVLARLRASIPPETITAVATDNWGADGWAIAYNGEVDMRTWVPEEGRDRIAEQAHEEQQQAIEDHHANLDDDLRVEFLTNLRDTLVEAQAIKRGEDAPRGHDMPSVTLNEFAHNLGMLADNPSLEQHLAIARMQDHIDRYVSDQGGRLYQEVSQRNPTTKAPPTPLFTDAGTEVGPGEEAPDVVGGNEGEGVERLHQDDDGPAARAVTAAARDSLDEAIAQHVRTLDYTTRQLDDGRWEVVAPSSLTPGRRAATAATEAEAKTLAEDFKKAGLVAIRNSLLADGAGLLDRMRKLSPEGARDIIGALDAYHNARRAEPGLLVMHSLSAGKLLLADKAGGLVAPSLGVGHADHPYRFNALHKDAPPAITLIGPTDLADPEGQHGVRWFDADIYSPVIEHNNVADELARIKAAPVQGAGWEVEGMGNVRAMLSREFHTRRDMLDARHNIAPTYGDWAPLIDRAHALADTLPPDPQVRQDVYAAIAASTSPGAGVPLLEERLTRQRDGRMVSVAEGRSAAAYRADPTPENLQVNLLVAEVRSRVVGGKETIADAIAAALAKAKTPEVRAKAETMLDVPLRNANKGPVRLDPAVGAELDAIADELRKMPVTYFEGKHTDILPIETFHLAVVADDLDPQALNALHRRGVQVVTFPNNPMDPIWSELQRKKVIRQLADEHPDLLFHGQDEDVERGQGGGPKGWIEFRRRDNEAAGLAAADDLLREGKAVITLTKKGDLTTLVHEHGHLVRRMLARRPDLMREVDALVVEKFGPRGWDATEGGVKVAEEWFARQFEAYMMTGNLEPKEAASMAPRALRALRAALYHIAKRLTAIYKTGRLEEVHPTVRRMFDTFLGLEAKGLIHDEPLPRSEGEAGGPGTGQASETRAGDPSMPPRAEPPAVAPVAPPDFARPGGTVEAQQAARFSLDATKRAFASTGEPGWIEAMARPADAMPIDPTQREHTFALWLEREHNNHQGYLQGPDTRDFAARVRLPHSADLLTPAEWQGHGHEVIASGGPTKGETRGEHPARTAHYEALAKHEGRPRPEGRLYQDEPATERHPLDTYVEQTGPVHWSMPLHSVERAIASLPQEHAVMFAGDGRQLYRAGPTETMAFATTPEGRAFLGGQPPNPATMCVIQPIALTQARSENGRAVFTHNHPSSSPPSVEDILVAAHGNFREARATTRDGFTWVAARPPAGWPEPAAIHRAYKYHSSLQIAQAMRDMDDIVRKAGGTPGSASAVGYSEAKWKELVREAFVRAWSAVSSELGISLTRESHPGPAGLDAEVRGAGGVAGAGPAAPAPAAERHAEAVGAPPDTLAARRAATKRIAAMNGYAKPETMESLRVAAEQAIEEVLQKRREAGADDAALETERQNLLLAADLADVSTDGGVTITPTPFSAAAAETLMRDQRALRRPARPDAMRARRLLKEAVAKAPGGEEAYEAWYERQLAPLRKQQVFTPAGRSRSIPYTAENVLAELVKNVRGGESFNYGLGNARAKGAKEYRTMSGLQADRGRIVSREAMDAHKTTLDEAFTDLQHQLQPYHTGGGGYGMLDAIAEAVADSYKEGARAALRHVFKDVPPDVVNAVREFADRLRTSPTEYMEGKAQRILPLREFQAAVVPKDVDPRVLDVLRKNGIEHIETYDKGDRRSREAQVEAIQRAAAARPDVLFQDEPENPIPQARGTNEYLRYLLTDSDPDPHRPHRSAVRVGDVVLSTDMSVAEATRNGRPVPLWPGADAEGNAMFGQVEGFVDTPNGVRVRIQPMITLDPPRTPIFKHMRDEHGVTLRDANGEPRWEPVLNPDGTQQTVQRTGIRRLPHGPEVLVDPARLQYAERGRVYRNRDQMLTKDARGRNRFRGIPAPPTERGLLMHAADRYLALKAEARGKAPDSPEVKALREFADTTAKNLWPRPMTDREWAQLRAREEQAAGKWKGRIKYGEDSELLYRDLRPPPKPSLDLTIAPPEGVVTRRRQVPFPRGRNGESPGDVVRARFESEADIAHAGYRPGGVDETPTVAPTHVRKTLEELERNVAEFSARTQGRDLTPEEQAEGAAHQAALDEAQKAADALPPHPMPYAPHPLDAEARAAKAAVEEAEANLDLIRRAQRVQQAALESAQRKLDRLANTRVDIKPRRATQRGSAGVMADLEARALHGTPRYERLTRTATGSPSATGEAQGERPIRLPLTTAELRAGARTRTRSNLDAMVENLLPDPADRARLDAMRAIMERHAWVPAPVREAMSRHLDDILARVPEDKRWAVAPLIATYKQTVTRGTGVTTPKYFLNNVPGDFDQTVLGHSFQAALRTAIRQDLQNVLAIPGLGNVVTLGGWKLGHAEALRRAIQVGGDAVEHLLWRVDKRLEVNAVLDGRKDVVLLGGRPYRYTDIRDAFVRGGVFEGFDVTQLRTDLQHSASAWEGILDVATQNRVLQDLAEGIATRKRVGLGVTLIEMGMTPEEAAKSVVTCLYDYKYSLSEGDKHDFTRTFLPFWAWQKNANRQVLAAMFTRQGFYRAKVLYQGKRIAAQLLTQWLDDRDDYGMRADEMPDAVFLNYARIVRDLRARGLTGPEIAGLFGSTDLTYGESPYCWRNWGPRFGIDTTGMEEVIPYMSLDPNEQPISAFYAERPAIRFYPPVASTPGGYYDFDTYRAVLTPPGTAEGALTYTQGLLAMSLGGVEAVGTGAYNAGHAVGAWGTRRGPIPSDIATIQIANGVQNIVDVSRSPLLDVPMAMTQDERPYMPMSSWMGAAFQRMGFAHVENGQARGPITPGKPPLRYQWASPWSWTFFRNSPLYSLDRLGQRLDAAGGKADPLAYIEFATGLESPYIVPAKVVEQASADTTSRMKLIPTAKSAVGEAPVYFPPQEGETSDTGTPW